MYLLQICQLSSTYLSLEPLGRGYACIKNASPCSHVWIFGWSTSVNMFVGWNVFGKGIDYFVILTISTQCNMNMYFSNPNWVHGFPPLFGFFIFFIFCWRFVYVVCCFLRCPYLLCLDRETCMALSCSVAFTFPSWDPRHMHATSSSCGDVLQMGVGRGLHQSLSTHAST